MIAVFGQLKILWVNIYAVTHIDSLHVTAYIAVM